MSTGDLSSSHLDFNHNAGDPATPDGELCDLDPDEFELPTVDCPPTLDEILRIETTLRRLVVQGVSLKMAIEDDLTASGESESFLGVLNGEGEGEGDSGGKGGDALSTISSLPSTVFSSRSALNNEWKHPRRLQQHSQLLRLSKLKGVSAQLLSAAGRISAGSPTALALHSPQAGTRKGGGSDLIAVGTSHGMVLVFDANNQALKYSLGSSQKRGEKLVTAEFGRVSALDFSRNGARLLVGYSKGHAQLADAANGRIVMSLRPDQVHQEGHGILHLRFTENSSVAVCVDSGGSVFELKFGGSVMGLTCRTRCIFSGCRGEVCEISTLSIPPKLRPTSKHYSDPLLGRRALVLLSCNLCLKY